MGTHVGAVRVRMQEQENYPRLSAHYCQCQRAISGKPIMDILTWVSHEPHSHSEIGNYSYMNEKAARDSPVPK